MRGLFVFGLILEAWITLAHAVVGDEGINEAVEKRSFRILPHPPICINIASLIL